MKKILAALMLVFIVPSVAGAQTAIHKKHKHKVTHKTAPAISGATLPGWASAHKYDATTHIYFPDYYVYYDPARGGYIFWDTGKWNFSPAVPPFLEKVDLSSSRVQILKGLSLDLHPELNYPYYMKLYPAEHSNNLVPVPPPGGN